MKKNLENVVSPSSFFNFQVTESYFCYLTFRSILDSFCSKSDIYSERYYCYIKDIKMKAFKKVA